MNCRIVLLDKNTEYGNSMEEYFRKKNGLGELKRWELVHIKTIEGYELPKKDENWVDFFLVGGDFSEKDLIVEITKREGVSRENIRMGFLSDRKGEPFYRYGGPEKIIIEIDREISGRRSTEEKNGKKTMSVLGIGLAGGVGNTTILLAVNDLLRARGFKTIFIDMNYWGNLKRHSKSEKIIDLSYLRFIYKREPLDFEKALLDVIVESGEAGSLVVGPIFEMDSTSESVRNEIQKIIEQVLMGGLFDFAILDGNKHMLAGGYFNDFALDQIVVADSFQEESDGFLDRLCSYYRYTMNTDVIQIINRSPLSGNNERTDVFNIVESTQPEARGLKVGSKNMIWAKKAKGNLRGEIMDTELIADYLIGRWLKTEKH